MNFLPVKETLPNYLDFSDAEKMKNCIMNVITADAYVFTKGAQ